MASNNNNSGSNRILVPNARQALNQMKLEIASELGLSNYESIDKGELSSRQNGYVGGYITRRLVEHAQQSLSGNPTGSIFTGESQTPPGR